jgi:hypothetical protein
MVQALLLMVEAWSYNSNTFIYGPSLVIWSEQFFLYWSLILNALDLAHALINSNYQQQFRLKISLDPDPTSPKFFIKKVNLNNKEGQVSKKNPDPANARGHLIFMNMPPNKKDRAFTYPYL